MRKKYLSVFLCMAMAAAALSGCGGSGSSNNSADKSEGDGLKIAIVSSPSGVDDGSFNEENYNGLLDFVEAHPGSTVTPVQESTGDTAAAIKAVEDIVVDYDAIVCDGFQFAGIGEIADDNPDKKFILVDTFPSDADGNEIELDNVYGMSFKEQEAGFLAGMAAALSTNTKKVAVVNGIAFPTNVNYQYGFMSGVNYANKHYDTGAEIVELASYAGTDVTGANVGGNYVGSFADPANGKVVGDALIKEGCDVIFVAAGGSGTGVLTAIKESSAKDYMIGCDTDQYDDGANGSDNVILTSALKIMGANDKKVLETVLDGSFKGGNFVLGADTDSVGYVSDSSRCQLSSDTIEKIDKAYELIKNGTIVPAANFNNMTPDNFTGLDAE
ncbi:nucleoside-binding protein [Lachnospiraceae bacterium]|nr:nucleoside-binding protein [Lachnospiraceae bacterium]